MATKLTLTEQIYQTLYQDIIKQRLRCGQKLTLKELKERFGVSQTPIREALTVSQRKASSTPIQI